MEEEKKTFTDSLKNIVGMEIESDKTVLLSLLEKLNSRKDSLKEELKKELDEEIKEELKDTLRIVNSQIEKCERLLETNLVPSNGLDSE